MPVSRVLELKNPESNVQIVAIPEDIILMTFAVQKLRKLSYFLIQICSKVLFFYVSGRSRIQTWKTVAIGVIEVTNKPQ